MAARIFSVANQKGETGKTTLSMSFASGLAKCGRTLVVDADPQGLAWQWSSLVPEDRLFSVSVIRVGGNLSSEVKRFGQDYVCGD